MSNERKVRVVACILGIDKTQDDEMIYRYIIPTTTDNPHKLQLPGGYLKEDMDRTGCMMEYIQEQLGLDIMEAGDNQAILGYECFDLTNPNTTPDQDVVFLYSISIQLQYLIKLMRDPETKLLKRILEEKDDEGNTVEEWAFGWFDPEDDPRKEDWVNEWEKQLLVKDIEEKLGEDYFEAMDEFDDNDDEDED